MLFRVRKRGTLSVRLVARGDDDSLNGASAASDGLEEVVCTADVGLKGRPRMSLRMTDLRLGPQMKDDVNLVFNQEAFEQYEVFKRAANPSDALVVAAPDELAAGVFISNEGHNSRSLG
jgi:hypothetical protein